MAGLSRALLLCVALLPGAAYADKIVVGPVFGDTLPIPTDSSGWAYADFHYRPETRDLWVHVFAWADLSSPVIAGHIHCCLPFTEETPVALQLPGISATTSGSFSYTWDLTLESTFDPVFLAAHGGTAEGARNALVDHLSGGSYVDLHTVDHPNGEVGGTLPLFIPEPGTLFSVGLGLVGLSWCKRRRAMLAAG